MWNLWCICVPESVTQAKIARGEPMQCNLYVLLAALKHFVFFIKIYKIFYIGAIQNYIISCLKLIGLEQMD